MKLSHALVSALTISTALSATAAATEAPAPGRLRVHVDAALASWTQERPIYDTTRSPDDPRVNYVGLGIGRPREAQLGRPLIGFGVGYRVSPRVVLGSNVGLAYDRAKETNDSVTPNDFQDSTHAVGVILAPYLEVLLRTEGRVLPFVGARAGFAASVNSWRQHGVTASSMLEQSILRRDTRLSPLLGLVGGAHFFVAGRVSVDLALAFDQRWTHLRSRERMTLPETDTTSDWEGETWAFTLGAIGGLSMWF